MYVFSVFVSVVCAVCGILGNVGAGCASITFAVLALASVIRDDKIQIKIVNDSTETKGK